MATLTVLVADREGASRRALCAALAAADCRVVEASDYAAALRLVDAEAPDLALVVLSPPLVDGLECVRRLRLRAPVALIAIEPGGDDSVAIRALELGADDCLPAHVTPERLLAHARAVLRRWRLPAAERRQVLVAGDVTIDFARRRLFRRGQEIVLRPTEWQLLAELASNPGHLLPHEELLTRAWGPEYRHDRSYLRVGIRRLRRKLEDDANAPRYIRTVPGRGYLFEPSGL